MKITIWPEIELDVTVEEKGPHWVAKCDILGLVASGPVKSQVIDDMQNICTGQILFAFKNNRLDGLYRPPKEPTP